MQLRSAIIRLFSQLTYLLEQLSDEEYCMPVEALSGATIGQHYRHVIECFHELGEGYDCGDVNYDLRRRDRRLETCRQSAIRQLKFAEDTLGKADKPLRLHAAFDEGMNVCIVSTYYRELLHNLDHTVHHMAMIRLGLSAISGIRLPESFGIAWSTLKFRNNTNSIHSN